MSRQLRGLVLVGMLVVAACAPSGVAPSTPAPTTTVPGLAVPTAPEPGEQPSETGPIRAAPSVVSPDDLPDWPASYEGPRIGLFYPYGVEHVEYQVACLTDLGFSVWSTADGRGISVAEGTPFTLIDPARRACSQKAFEIGLVARDRFDEPDYRALVYRAWTWTYECLVEIGAPAVEPPTLETFIQGGPGVWHPYDGFPEGEVIIMEGAVAPPGVEEILEMQRACPAYLPYAFEKAGINPADLVGGDR